MESLGDSQETEGEEHYIQRNIEARSLKKSHLTMYHESEKPDTKGQTLCDVSYIHLEQANSWRWRRDWFNT